MRPVDRDISVDREARRRLAFEARRLLAGISTNDEFDYAWCALESFDPAIHAVYYEGFWTLYSDLHRHRLTGRHALSRETREACARLLLFLYTDQPYEWPASSILDGCLLSVLTLGWSSRRTADRKRREAELAGFDPSVWPFRDRAALTLAQSNPPLLNGAA